MDFNIFDDCECGGKPRVTTKTCTCDEHDKPIRISNEPIQIKQVYVTHNNFKSLSDIKDPELKEIFIDFNFKNEK